MGGGDFWLSVLTCAALLALALLCVQQMNRSLLARPLALLCLTLLAWNGASLAYERTSAPAFRWLDVSTSPWTAPLALDFTLAFVGLRRRLRAVRVASFSTMGALSLASALAFVWPAARGFAGSQLWSAIHLAGILAIMTIAVFLLARHLRDCGAAGAGPQPAAPDRDRPGRLRRRERGDEQPLFLVSRGG
jgi:hypothetical protein